MFTREELERVPDTKLRFVVYQKADYGTSVRRGVLDEKPQRIVARFSMGQSHVDDSGGAPAFSQARRVASCQVMFWNMFHEGLVFLSVFVNGRICMNSQSPVLRFIEDEVVIASIFYSNDVLVVFSACLQSVLGIPEVLEKYALLSTVDFHACWTYGTPEVLSGGTVLLSQTGILPRNDVGADLMGNLEDEARRTVQGTRGRLSITTHVAKECFEGVVPPAWKKEQAHLEGVANGVVYNLDCLEVDQGQHFATMSGVCEIPFDEVDVFIALQSRLWFIPKTVEEVRVANPTHFTRFENEQSADMLCRMMAVTGDIVEGVCAMNESLPERTKESVLSDSS